MAGPSPYQGLPDRAFWKTAVADRAPGGLNDVYRPKFRIEETTRIFTAGSCFAQHVGRALSGAGYQVIDEEPLPLAVPDDVAQRFGYRLYSARYGNVYTARQLVQLMEEAMNRRRLPSPVWRRDGRFYDAQRPNVEPDGLESADMVRAHRRRHLRRVIAAIGRADLAVFTFGLTEAWIHRGGAVYPTAPGVIADPEDPGAFRFHNFSYGEVWRDFTRFRAMAKSVNRRMRFLVTVSPVPLTATAADDHVQVATTYSKSVLRAVCGAARDAFRDVDYFPSYELIASPSARGAFFEPNMRAVTREGVDMAMSAFLAAHRPEGEAAEAMAQKGAALAATANTRRAADDVVCEEELLEAFAAR